MSDITITLLVLLCAAAFFVTEKLPVGVTSISAAVVLCLLGVIDAKTAFSGLVDTNVILFAGMFVVAGAMFETGLADEIGAKIIFGGLGIEMDPLDWYYMILDRKERQKHGSRRS